MTPCSRCSISRTWVLAWKEEKQKGTTNEFPLLKTKPVFLRMRLKSYYNLIQNPDAYNSYIENKGYSLLKTILLEWIYYWSSYNFCLTFLQLNTTRED